MNYTLRLFIIVILIEISALVKSPLKKRKKSESFESSEEIISDSVDLSEEENNKKLTPNSKISSNLINSEVIQPHKLFESDIIDKLNHEKINKKYSQNINTSKINLEDEKLLRKNLIKSFEDSKNQISQEEEILSNSVLSIPKENTTIRREITKDISNIINSFSEENLTIKNKSKIDQKNEILNSPLKKLSISPPQNKRYNDIQETPQNYEIIKNDDVIILDQFQIMPEFKNNRIISSLINIFFVITGLYVLFLGIKAFRFLMVILQFYICYYFLLFFLTEFDLYNYGSILQQITIFFSSIIFAFILAIFFYFIEKVNFIVFSIAVGSMLTLTYVQFFVDFKNNSDRLSLLIVYIGTSLVCSSYAFFYQTRAVIFGSVFVGAVIVPINLGILFNDFKSFETREHLPLDNFTDFIKHLIIISILLVLGSLSQFYIKRRIIQENQDYEIEKANEEILADISEIN